jgi:hypothetical protein
MDLGVFAALISRSVWGALISRSVWGALISRSVWGALTRRKIRSRRAWTLAISEPATRVGPLQKAGRRSREPNNRMVNSNLNLNNRESLVGKILIDLDVCLYFFRVKGLMSPKIYKRPNIDF